MPQSVFWPFARNKQEDNVDFGGQTVLQRQLGAMEGEVKEIQMELAAIRRNRQDVKTNALGGVVVVPDEALKNENFYESYTRYLEEKCNKGDTEVSKLRDDLIRSKNNEEKERLQRIKYEGKLQDLELKLNNICSAGKAIELEESRKITEDVGLKTQLRDLKEQIEEMKITDDEKSQQLQEYRVKYLQAQQQVEELKRQINVMEFDNKQASDQIQIELHLMKMQFEEKILELAPLPDLLKGSQIQLQEAQQFQKLAEDNTQQISHELHQVKEKLVVAVSNFNQEKMENSKLIQENNAYKIELDEKQKEIDGLTKEIEDYKSTNLRLEEKLRQLEIRSNEKAAEFLQLSKDLEELKEESARSFNRLKERSDSSKHYLQTQIAGLERQMITCRAQCRSYQKERDEIRQRTQLQISNLKENFNMVEVRVRGLQKQLGLLKHYNAITMPEDIEYTSETDNNTSCYPSSPHTF